MLRCTTPFEQKPDSRITAVTPPPLNWQDIPGAPEPGTRLARLDEIPDGGAFLLTLDTSVPPFKAILLRSGTQVFAYVNRCAHFGVPLAAKVEHLYPKAHRSFQCSVHQARYRWQDGVCEFGDCAGESLLAIPVVITNGWVLTAGHTD
jgi:nitrite reductase/ring-hydroxylating ferredoxin subunit